MAFTTQKYSGSGSLTIKYDPGSRFILENVRMTLDSAASTAENFTGVLDSAEGSEYNVEFMTQQMNAVKTFIWCFGNENKYEKGDKLDFGYANTDGRTWGVEIRVMTL